MSECSCCEDPKGDLLCEKCAEEIYDQDDPSDEEALRFGATIVIMAFAFGLTIGCIWGRMAAIF